MAVKSSGQKDKPKRQASVRAQRFAAGLNVTVGVVAAVAVTVLLNYLSHMGYWRKDFQTLGQYGLSDRTRKILDQIDQPVTMTVIYASPDKARLGRRYRSRVAELCREMADHSDKISVVDASDDETRAEVLDELRRSLAGQAVAHRKLIERFEQFTVRADKQLSDEIAGWRGRDRVKLLAGFHLPVIQRQAMEEVKTLLTRAKDKLDLAVRSTAVPDYAAVARDAAEASGQAQETCQALGRAAKGVKDLVEAVAADNGKLAKDSAAAFASLDAAMKAYAGTLGAKGDPAPDKPADVLSEFITAGEKVLGELATCKADLAKTVQAHPIVRRHDKFQANVSMHGPFVQVFSLPDLLGDVARQVQQLNAQARLVMADQAIHVQKTLVQDLRTLAGGVGKLVEEVSKSWQGLLSELADAPPSAKAALEESAILASLAATAGKIASDGQGLPKLDTSGLGQKIVGDNVVLIEADGRTDVVDFEATWPVAKRQVSGTDEDGPRRLFNGNQAIGGKLLAMTSEPFAEVVLTYFEWTPPQWMRGQMQPVTSNPPRFALNKLVETLRAANIEVTDWNLAGRFQPGAPPNEVPEPPPVKEGLPRILLILPPPEDLSMFQRQGPPTPKFTAAHLEKITALVDAGTPAVFLTGFKRPDVPGLPADPLEEYLRQKWGVDVRSTMLTIMAVPDPRRPDEFSISELGTWWLPLSSFTDHPVGAPLRARQMHWLRLCPVLAVESLPEGVKIEPILRVPARRKDIWAEANIRELASRQMDRVKPQTDQGDLVGPFTIAVEAVRTKGKDVHRIIVAGVAHTYVDGYLAEPVRQFSAAGSSEVVAPPPVGTLAVLTNACYWLADKQAYIAAGAVDRAPVGYVSQGQMTTMKLLVIILWPALVLALGVAVMIVRRRH